MRAGGIRVRLADRGIHSDTNSTMSPQEQKKREGKNKPQGT